MRRTFMTTLAALLAAAATLAAPAVSDAADAGPGAKAFAAAAPDPWVAGTFFPLYRPARFFDSRGSFGRPLRSGETVDVKVTGRGEAPRNGVSAVVLNLTVTGPTTAGNVVALPKGVQANTSSLNFVAGETRANLVTVPVSADGYVSVRNNARGTTNLVVDVEGYYLSGYAVTEYGGTDYFPLRSFRVLDTRGGTKVSPERTTTVPVRVPDDGVANSTQALALTVTVVNPPAAGYLALWDGISYPTTSHLNFAKGATTSNSVIVGTLKYPDDLKSYFSVSAFGASPVDVVIDVNGAYSVERGGSVLHVLPAPQRIVDSRIGRGSPALGAADTNAVQVSGSVAPSGTAALVTNSTVVTPTAPTYLTLWKDGTSRPYGSNLNAAAGQTVANQVMVPVSDGRFDVYNDRGRSDLLVDVMGRFEPARR